jgi:hypothetical protein
LRSWEERTPDAAASSSEEIDVVPRSAEAVSARR